MPRGLRAIGDILRGKRGDVDMSDDEVTRDALEGDLDEDQRRALKTATTAETTFTPPDLDPARRLLFGWSLRRFLDTRPPSTVVTVPRTATVGEAMAALARHGILSAPVLDEKNAHFHGFLSCLDILHAFVDGLDPALTRGSYVASRTREQRMAELDLIAEDFLDAGCTKIRTSPDGRLVYKGHGDDATMLDVVSHGFFFRRLSDFSPKGSAPLHCATIEPAAPLTSTQRDARREAAQSRERDKGGGSSETAQAPDFAAAAAIEAQAFTRTVGVCHRVAVFEHDEAADAMRVVAIVSQLDVLRFLSRKVDALGPKLADASLEELGLVGGGPIAEAVEFESEDGPNGATVRTQITREPLDDLQKTTRTTIARVGAVVTAPWDATALECFKLMRERNVSAVGIVDHAGELVANLSASDMRRLDRESFRLLALPVAEFISRRKGDAIGRRDAPFAEARRLDELDMNDVEEGAAARSSSAAKRAREKKPDGFSFESFSSRQLETIESSRVFRSPRSPVVSDRTFVELVFARSTTTLRKALSLFARHGIHHVYVVDDDDAPVAVLTPTDVLRLFAVDDDDSKWHNAWHGEGAIAA
jgi:CBS domain-containing protein